MHTLLSENTCLDLKEWHGFHETNKSYIYLIKHLLVNKIISMELKFTSDSVLDI